MGGRGRALVIGALVVAQIWIVMSAPSPAAADDLPGISGTVLFDGEPLVDADPTWRVRLEDAAMQMQISEIPLQSDGTFHFASVEYGTYTVSYGPLDQGSVPSRYHPEVNDAASAATITIDETTPGRSDVDITLAGGSISGTVTAGSTPVAGAQIHVAAGPSFMGTAPTATTDASGAYTVRGMPSGEYRIGVNPADSPNIYYLGGGTDLYNATTITIEESPAIDNDIVLGGGGFTGTLSDSEGPLAGRTVVFTPPPVPDNGVGGSTVTDDDGTFTVRYLPAGTYSVTVTDSMTYASVPLPDTYSSDGASLTPLTVVLPDGSIGGTVTRNGTPVIDEYFTAHLTPTTANSSERTVAINTWTGMFSFAHVADGQYYVSVEPMSLTNRTYHPSAGSTADATVITVGPDARAVVDIDVALPTGAISGNVTSGGSGAAGIDVSVYDAMNEGQYFGSVPTTPGDGAFMVGSLPNGTYKVAYSFGAGQMWVGGIDFSTATTYTISADTPTVTGVDITLASGVIEGHVLDGDSPIQDMSPMVWIDLNDDTGVSLRETIAQMDGSFRFANLPDGTYYLRFSEGSGWTAYYPSSATIAGATPIVIDALNQTHSGLDVHLPDGTVSGTITAGDAPVEGATVRIYDAPTMQRADTTTDASGEYTLTGLPDGTYQVAVSPPGAQLEYYHGGASTAATYDEATPIALSGVENDLIDIDIDMATGGLSGFVRQADAPVTFASLVATASSPDATTLTANATSDDTGEFTFRYLPAGTYRISATTDVATIQLAGAFTTDGTTITSGIELAIPSGRISGVIRRGSVPVTSGWVTLEPLTGPGGQMRSVDLDGTYSFDNIDDGQYRVSFSNGMASAGYAPGVRDLVDARIVTIDTTTPQVLDVDIALPNGRITGRFTQDGAPVAPPAGARLTADLTTGAFSSESADTIVNADGTYEITGLYPGSYVVSYEAGPTLMYPPTITSSAYAPGVAHPFDADVVVVPAASSTTSDVDIEIPTGTVTVLATDSGGALNGAARDLDIVLTEAISGRTRTQRVDGAGSVTFSGVPDGDYYISWNDLDSGATGSYPVESAPGRHLPVSVTPTDRHPSAVTVAFDHFGSVSGTITNAAGQPISRSVRIITVGPAGNPVGSTALNTESAPDGSYTFPYVPPGTYTVAIEEPSLGSWMTVSAPSTLNPAPDDFIDVAAGEVLEVNLQIPGLVTVSGRVLDDDGEPVAGVTVNVIDGDGTNTYMATRRPVATTGADGTYTSVAFLPRRHIVEFVPPAGSGLASTFHGAPASSAATILTPVSGADLTGIDGVVGEPGSISGTITDPGGDPTPAWVVLFPLDVRAGVSVDPPPRISAPDGTYAFDDVPPGEWVVQASSTGFNGLTSVGRYAVTYSGGVYEIGDATPIELTSDGSATADVQLLDGRMIRGVVSGPDGEPLAGISVSASTVANSPFPSSHTVFTAADGSYELTGLTPGQVLLGFFPNGTAPWLAGKYYPDATTLASAHPVTIPETGAISDIDVQLGATITGTATLVDADGDPVTHRTAGTTTLNAFACAAGEFIINYYGCKGMGLPSSTGQFDLETGTFLFAGLSPGEYTLRAASTLPSPVSATIDLASGDTFHCTLPISSLGGAASCTVGPQPTGATIRGRVIGPNGQPIAGVNVGAHRSMYLPTAGDTTDVDGYYEFSVPTGSYRIAITEPSRMDGLDQYSLAEWYSDPDTNSYVTEFSEAVYLTQQTLDVEANEEYVLRDVHLERYATAEVEVSGGSLPAGTVMFLACPAPEIIGTTTFGCVDPVTGQRSGMLGSFARDDSTFRAEFMTPGTYTVGAVSYDPLWMVGTMLTKTATFSVAGSEAATCTLPVVGSADDPVCNVEPIDFGVHPDPDPDPDPDSDGVDDEEETGAPNGGDGNGDGTPDAEQPAVASLLDPSLPDPDPEHPGANYITLVSQTAAPATGTAAALTAVSLTAVDPQNTPPAGAAPQTSLISFSADYRDPADLGAPIDEGHPITGVFEILLPAPATQYWKYDETNGTWTDATSLVTFLPSVMIGGVPRWPVTISIIDGGFGDADGTVNGVIVDPGTFTNSIYRARNGDPTRGEDPMLIIVERTIAASPSSVADHDPDGDGWAVVGQSQNDNREGIVANFWVDDDGVPHAALRHPRKGCVTLTPKKLDRVKAGQNRGLTLDTDTRNCRRAAASADVDDNGLADNLQPLYRIEQTTDGTILVWRSVAAAEARHGISDWDGIGRGTGWALYGDSAGTDKYNQGAYFTLSDLNGDGVPDPIVFAEHTKKGCFRLEPAKTDPVRADKIRNLKVVAKPGGACPE